MQAGRVYYLREDRDSQWVEWLKFGQSHACERLSFPPFDGAGWCYASFETRFSNNLLQQCAHHEGKLPLCWIRDSLRLKRRYLHL